MPDWRPWTIGAIQILSRPDGRILIVGGIGRGWAFLRSAEVYDPATGRSELVGSMAVPRESHTATLLADGRVLVIGGHSGRRPNVKLHASAELFDPQTRRFENAGTLAAGLLRRAKSEAHDLPTDQDLNARRQSCLPSS